ncbi:MAG: DUF4843 domain-containing protein [Odoribacteraceae bacterium]|jgi:hypothetical protein|nr:DUF4843 domain-containing protein [Odoribacteraceae bacterium]
MNRILMIGMTLLLFNCTEENLKYYDGTTSIYFQVLENNTRRILDTVEFGFGPTSYVEYDFPIQVTATGDVMDIDRVFKVKVEDTDDAVRGSDFDMADEFIFPAGQSRAYVLIKLYRGPEDDDTTRFVTLRLQPNEYFDIDLPYRYRSTLDSVNVTRMTVQFTSAMPRPRQYMEIVLGYFSVDKLLLLNELCNMTYEKWNSTTPISAVGLIGYSVALKNYLQYRISLGPDMAIKDPSPKSHRGYMCLGAGHSTDYGEDVVIPAEWPDAPQRSK